MPDVYLGPSGSETLLPAIRSFDTLPNIPIPQTNQYDKSIMSDGSPRYNVKPVNPRKWTFKWDNLTAAVFAVLKGHNDRREALHFQNGWEGVAWTWVWIAEFSPEINMEISTSADIRWMLVMTLEEIPA
jgi:hypothetical protein